MPVLPVILSVSVSQSASITVCVIVQDSKGWVAFLQQWVAPERFGFEKLDSINYYTSKLVELNKKVGHCYNCSFFLPFFLCLPFFSYFLASFLSFFYQSYFFFFYACSLTYSLGYLLTCLLSDYSCNFISILSSAN